MGEHDELERIARSRQLTIREAAEMSGIGERLLRRAIEEGRLGHVKFGAARNSPVRVPVAALEAWIASHYRAPKQRERVQHPARRTAGVSAIEPRFPRQRRREAS